MVHGDDFVAVGKERHLQETQKALEEKYKLKVEKLGAEKNDAKEIRVLNTVIRHTDDGLELEADPRHVELVVRELGLESARTTRTPGAKPARKQLEKKTAEAQGELDIPKPDRKPAHPNPPESRHPAAVEGENDEDGEGPVLQATEARRFRAVVARLNYLASDRPDVQFAVKEVARNMSSPRASHWPALRRIGMYLKGRPRLVLKYLWQKAVGTAVAYTDSDWAGCPKTAKSTSGGIVTLGGHLVKSYSRQQKTVALSSAEAELHAMVAASAETLGIIGLCRDMGMEIAGEVYADSSAALGIAQRSGVGKVRHLRVQALWVQEVRCTGRLGYKKVLGTRNPADILTKHVPVELLDAHLQTLGVESREGRAVSAPELNSVEAVTLQEENKKIKKKVRFHRFVEYRAIPETGAARPTSSARKIRQKEETTVVAADISRMKEVEKFPTDSVSPRTKWEEIMAEKLCWADCEVDEQ